MSGDVTSFSPAVLYTLITLLFNACLLWKSAGSMNPARTSVFIVLLAGSTRPGEEAWLELV